MATGDTEEFDGLEHPAVLYLRTVLNGSLRTARHKAVVSLLATIQVMSVATWMWPNSPQILRTIATLCLLAGLGLLVVYGLLIPISSILRSYQHLERQRRDESAKCEGTSGVNACLENLYGLRRDLAHTTTELAEDGSAKATLVVTATALSTQVQELWHFYAGGNTGGDPDQCFAVEVEELDCPCEFDYDVAEPTPRGVSWSVIFRPELPMEAPATYSSCVTLPPRSFIMSREVLVGRSELERVSHEVTYPTQELRMSVVMPKKWTWSKKKAEVWCDRGGLRNHAEEARLTRLEGGKTPDGRHSLNLTVTNPILGMRYVILWVPKEPKGWKAPVAQVVVAEEAR